jgi:hypothetical protein
MLSNSTSSEPSKRCLFFKTNAIPATTAIVIKATKPVGIISLWVILFWLVVVVLLGICVALLVGAGFGVGLGVGACVG